MQQATKDVTAVALTRAGDCVQWASGKYLFSVNAGVPIADAMSHASSQLSVVLDLLIEIAGLSRDEMQQRM